MGRILTEKDLEDGRAERMALYIRLGFSVEEADLLVSAEIQLEDVAQLLKRGCSHELAVKILL